MSARATPSAAGSRPFSGWHQGLDQGADDPSVTFPPGALDHDGVGLPPPLPTACSGTSREADPDLFETSYGLLSRLRPMAREADLKSLALCGLVSIRDKGVVIERRASEGGGSSLKGIRRCSSPLMCPVCGPRSGMSRAAKLMPQVDALKAAGWQAWLITLTIQHQHGDDLARLIGIMREAWSSMISGRKWTAMKAGGLEYVRGFDFTHGVHGGHPHWHVSVFIAPGRDADAVSAAFVDLWRESVAKAGGTSLALGQDRQLAQSGRAAVLYAMTPAGQSKKARLEGLAEVTGAATKRSGQGRTVRDLALAAVAGDRTAERVWIELARATKGLRMVVVSQGLKLDKAGKAGGDDEVIEPEVVAHIIGGARTLRRLDPHLAAILRASAVSVTAGRAALRAVLGPPGRRWIEPPPDPPGDP